jgi:hypothetical protein
MTRNEIIDFLSLAPNTTDDELLKAILEKESYFKSLVSNAPTNLLKKVYEKNIDKLKEFQVFIVNSQQKLEKPAIQLDINSEKNSSPDFTLSTAPTLKYEPAWLIRHTENSSTISFALTEGINTIGRLIEGCTLNVGIEKDMFVSRQHAIIEIIQDNYILYDIGEMGVKASKNGVFVNGSEKRLKGKYLLKEGDTIQFGNTKFVFKINTQRNIADVVNEVSHSDYMRTVVINIL